MLRESLSSTLASLPARVHEERAELLALLRRDGILRRTPTQPVLSRDGTSARWMLDSLSVTLSPRGAELAGRCVLELLKKFDGRQIATYGLTAVPILQSCLLQSNGEYRGLLVRKERKKHGSLKLIEGVIDPSEPVVLVDDSVSSGTSLTEGCERLEEAGLRVEGAVALVRFGWYGGYALMQERGYHVEAVYDIWDDFIHHMDDEEKPLANPSKWFPEIRRSNGRAPEGLHPARLARLVVEEYLSSGELLLAPARLDREYDSAGGAWISVRSRSDIHLRHARDGFWHFPGEARWETPEDVVMASLRTAAQMPAGEEGLRALAESGVAVTFFPALERCTVGALDNERYGIVVRSLERPDWMGGALPRMPGISNEWEQFQHARRKNGRLVSFEPYEIFRHEVVKAVEPETDWQPTGVPAGDATPWHRDEKICAPVAARARDLVVSLLAGRDETASPLSRDHIPAALDSVYVTVYVEGRLRGCMGSVVRDLDSDLERLARAAVADERFAGEAGTEGEWIDPASVAVSVSFLFAPLVLGYFTPEEVTSRVRQGEQTLMAYDSAGRVGLLLPFVASMQNLDRVAFARAVLEKAGIEGPPYNWCRFDCATWLAEAGGTRPLVGGFPAREPEESPFEVSLSRLATLHTDYLLRQAKDDGTLYLSYEPFQNRLREGIEAARLAHAAWTLARAGGALGRDDAREAARKIVDRLIAGLVEDERGCWIETRAGGAPSVAESSFLLLALLELPGADERRGVAPRIASTLWSCVGEHGRVATHRPPAESPEAYQDYAPGQLLLALAAATAAGVTEADEAALGRAFRYYRHRFRYRRHFGQVSWLMQSFALWPLARRDTSNTRGDATPDAAGSNASNVGGEASILNGGDPFAGFVFEIGDWVLGYQQTKTGGFINDHQPDAPGYTTALYLEGIAAALKLAAARGDETRRARYSDSVERGFRFLDGLVIQRRDASVLPNPAFASGGLRQSVHRSEVRVDFVQHSLSAALGLHPFA